MMIVLSAASIVASAWVIWRLHMSSTQLNCLEADVTRLLKTTRP